MHSLIESTFPDCPNPNFKRNPPDRYNESDGAFLCPKMRRIMRVKKVFRYSLRTARRKAIAAIEENSKRAADRQRRTDAKQQQRPG